MDTPTRHRLAQLERRQDELADQLADIKAILKEQGDMFNRLVSAVERVDVE